jgi:hypothetical protein
MIFEHDSVDDTRRIFVRRRLTFLFFSRKLHGSAIFQRLNGRRDLNLKRLGRKKGLGPGSKDSLYYLHTADGDGAVEVVADFAVGGIAEAVEDGGDEVVGLDFAFHGEGGVLVGGAVDHAARDATACPGQGEATAPVIAAAVVVETGGVAEFADPKADGC